METSQVKYTYICKHYIILAFAGLFYSESYGRYTHDMFITLSPGSTVIIPKRDS